MEKIITKIEVQKNKKDRVNVFINEEYAFSCSMELAYSRELKKGNVICLEDISEVIKEDNYVYCKETALRTLERTLKTEKEIITKLKEKGFEEDAIYRTVAFLKEYDFVNDYKYVKLYVKEKVKKDGINKIKFNLMKKGIKEELIDKELSFYRDNSDDYMNNLRQLARKKYEVLSKGNLDDIKLRKKISDHLFRKGYSWDEIKSVTIELFKDAY